MTLLSAHNLTVTAAIDGQSVEVLRDLTFSIETGTTLGVVGESGAGKSMIGRVVAGMLPPGFAVSRGSMKFNDEDLVAAGSKRLGALLGREIAFIPQHPLTSLNPVRTVGAQFDEHLRRLGVGGRAPRRELAVQAFADVHLSNPEALLRCYPHQLSGGMCQRVLIAMAFVGEPPFIIADEPTTALDVITQARIMGLIAELREKHRTSVMFVTHDLRLAAQVCDEILVVYAGEVVERGPAREVFGEPLHPYTRSLQLCNPPLTGPRRKLVSLPDHMPGISRFAELKGCRFAPRCPIGDAECADTRPEIVELEPRRWARCSPGCLAGAKSKLSVEAAPADTTAPTEKAAPILEISDLSKTFHLRGSAFGLKRRKVEALRSVSLNVGVGEFVGVVGESGSGKTTFARLLLGLETPTTGRIVMDGRDVTGPFSAHADERIELIQMVFQDPQSALNPRRRVSRLVTQAMERKSQSVPWPDRLRRAQSLLSDTGLAPDTIDRYPMQLSGGQRQRVNIARALCTTPKILIADEIVSGLDVSIQAQILNLLLELRRSQQVTLIFISHDLTVVRYLCSRVIVMREGDVVEAGPTDAVFSKPQHPYTRALISAVPPDDFSVKWKPAELELSRTAGMAEDSLA